MLPKGIPSFSAKPWARIHGASSPTPSHREGAKGTSSILNKDLSCAQGGAPLAAATSVLSFYGKEGEKGDFSLVFAGSTPNPEVFHVIEVEGTEPGSVLALEMGVTDAGMGPHIP